MLRRRALGTNLRNTLENLSYTNLNKDITILEDLHTKNKFLHMKRYMNKLSFKRAKRLWNHLLSTNSYLVKYISSDPL